MRIVISYRKLELIGILEGEIFSYICLSSRFNMITKWELGILI